MLEGRTFYVTQSRYNEIKPVARIVSSIALSEYYLLNLRRLTVDCEEPG
jgi:hypothetical protein